LGFGLGQRADAVRNPREPGKRAHELHAQIVANRSAATQQSAMQLPWHKPFRIGGNDPLAMGEGDSATPFCDRSRFVRAAQPAMLVERKRPIKKCPINVCEGAVELLSGRHKWRLADAGLRSLEQGPCVGR
jgi:hypothetical protein